MSENLNSTSQYRPQLDALFRMGVAAALAGIVIGAFSYFGGIVHGSDPGRFFQAYLFAYIFWMGVTMGPIALLLLHNTTGGGWGFMLKRQLTAASKLLPLMALLFVPMLFGLKYIYPWANEAVWSKSDELVLQQKWMAVPFVMVRLVFYFGVLFLLQHFVNKWTWSLDKRNVERNIRLLNTLGPPGIVIYVICVTFLAVDILMTITPGWMTSIIGLLFVVGQGLSSFSLMSVLTAYLAAHREPLAHVPRRYIRDIGNFMLAFTLLWSYMSFGQLVITFSGNMAEEAAFYQARQHGGWQIVGILLVAAHFVLPFLALLSSTVKTNISNLAKLGMVIIFMRFVDLYYWVVPAFEPSVNFSRLPLDIAMPLAIGGIWVAAWAVQMRDKPLIPELDPRLHGAWPLGTHHELEPIGYADVPEDAFSEAEVPFHG